MTIVPKSKDGTTVVVAPRGQTILPTVEIDNDELTLLYPQEERYKSLKKLGEGGAGMVDLVEDLDIHRVVAMKIAKGADEASVLARFVEEVRIIGQLEHPNIIPIHDVGMTQDGEYYFTMKYVEGESLREIIQKLQAGDPEYLQQYTFERRMLIFLEILRAVHFAHDRGFIHRDIKPDNIMIGRYGEVLLLDWGIAKKIHKDRTSSLDEVLQRQTISFDNKAKDKRIHETQHGALLGTPAYMAPEQVKGKVDEIDERTDIYSLSILFYEFMTLEHYLQEYHHDLQGQLLGVLSKTPTPPEQLSHPHQGKVPREHCFFLRRGYQKDPNDRYASVSEMIEILQDNLEGRIRISCPSTYAKRRIFDYGRLLDDHRFSGVAVGIILLLLVFLGIYQSAAWLAKLLL